MTEDMPRSRFPFLRHEKNRHGQWRWYFRRGDGKRIRLPGEFGSPEFEAAYDAARAGQPIRKSLAPQGTIRWLVERYKESGHFASLAPKTRANRDGIMRQVVAKGGDAAYAKVSRSSIQNGMDDRAKTPHAANNYLVAMNVLFNWAVKAGYLPANPCVGVEPRRDRIKGLHTWTMDQVERYRARHTVGTKARLALDLMLFTGLRISDAMLVGPQHIRDGILHVRTQKTKAPLQIPVFPELRASIDATPTGDMVFLTTEKGAAFASTSTFGPWFRKRCHEAKLPPECTAHGLRKAGATIAAENGASERELMAMFGWSRPAMAQVYTKAADQARLARAAAERIANNAAPHLQPGAARAKK